ncbi:MAG: hypothetical protein IJW48_03715, partial [Clostridia bacterium]|nr:hypothetical protein [Clostridia bacterium]
LAKSLQNKRFSSETTKNMYFLDFWQTIFDFAFLPENLDVQHCPDTISIFLSPHESGGFLFFPLSHIVKISAMIRRRPHNP